MKWDDAMGSFCMAAIQSWSFGVWATHLWEDESCEPKEPDGHPPPHPRVSATTAVHHPKLLKSVFKHSSLKMQAVH